MNAAGRLGIYGVGLVAVFAAAFTVGGVVVPESTVTAWADARPAVHDARATDPEQDDETPPEASVTGLSIAASGFVIGPVRAPEAAGVEGELAFEIVTTAGEPVTEYETAHGKQLHLIVVRSDGSEYRHVHPVLDTETGTWSLPWTWDGAGAYRVYADFTAGDGTSATLARTVNVAGVMTPTPSGGVTASDSVDGFDVTISGDLVAGTGSELTVDVTRDGAPVTALEPYLGAFGHLVALREGDLAYLHVHAHGKEPEPGDQAGPAVTFTAEAPTAGRYLLYLDFRVDGQVHTAAFVLDAAGPAAVSEDESDTGDDEHSGH